MIPWRFRTLFLAGLLALAIAVSCEVASAGTFLSGDLLRIDENLDLSAPSPLDRKDVFLPDARMDSPPSEKSAVEDRPWTDWRLGPFRLFWSRSDAMPANRDPGKALDRDGIFSRLKVLPGDLLHNPSRAAETVGRIFEPQLNLGLEF